MPIPNVPSLSQKIRRGSEGGQEFARIVDLLLAADARANNYPFSAPDDAGGDAFGVDSFTRVVHEDQSILIAYQYKFFPSPLRDKHRKQIEQSLQSAQQRFSKMMRWILVTPDDFLRSDAEWFESMVARHRRPYRPLEVGHWGHTSILSLMLRFPAVAKHYYPELCSSPLGSVVVGNLRMDEEHCEWVRVISSNLIRREYLPTFWQYTAYAFPLLFGDLDAETQRMFSEILCFIRARVCKDRGCPTDIRARFLSLSASEFYDSTMRGAAGDQRTAEQDVVWQALVESWPHYKEYEKLKSRDSAGLSLAWFNRSFMRTRDPIFDITLLNNTSQTEVLQRIKIEIDDYWPAQKAGPTKAYLLTVTDTYNISLRFPGWEEFDKNRDNLLELHNPVVMGPGVPARLRVRLIKFDKSCPPGITFVRLHFKFHLMASTTESEELVLDF